MPDKTVYVDFGEVNHLQQDIMQFVEWWVHEKKTPIPLKEIIAAMRLNGVKDYTTTFAINSLMRKKYLRRAIVISNKSSYVQLRRV
jgi:hypothetical protein